LRIYDLSLPLQTGMVTWPGDPPLSLVRALALDAGDGVNVSRLSLGTHTGTHVDAPAHLLRGGASVEALVLEHLIGPARVVYVPGAQDITVAALEALAIPRDCRRLLLKTHNSDVRLLTQATFRQDYVALSAKAARWLVERAICLVGIDALSVDPYAEEALPAHRTLLAHGVIIVEGLDLSAVPEGAYELCCLPLRIPDADGAPARVILRA
jgi:arylformamidase